MCVCVRVCGICLSVRNICLLLCMTDKRLTREHFADTISAGEGGHRVCVCSLWLSLSLSLSLSLFLSPSLSLCNPLGRQ